MRDGFISPASFWEPEYLVESAWLEHAPFAFWLTDALRPKTFVELGVHRGFSYFVFCQAFKALGLDSTAYAVDTWTGDQHAGFYGEEIFQEVSRHNAAYSDFSRLIRGAFADALDRFPEKSIDLLHIDGRYFYEDVLEDYSSWLPKLADEAIVIFHDTNVLERDFGVGRFFDELKTRHPNFHFEHGHGLGMLAPNRVPQALAPLFDLPAVEADEIRQIYASLGTAISTRWRLNLSLSELDARRQELKKERRAFENLEEHFDFAQMRTSAKLQQLEESRAYLASERIRFLRGLDRAYRRPLRPIKFWIFHRVFKALAAVSKPFSDSAYETFKRSAEKRHPRRFKRLLLNDPVVAWEENAEHLSQPWPIKTYQLATVDASSIRLPRSSAKPDISIVIPTYGQVDHTLNCLKSIADARPLATVEVIVAEDKSGDSRIAELRQIEGLILLENKTNLGFLRSCNAAISRARGDYIFLLNNDTMVAPHAIDALFDFARAQPEAGLVGARLVYPDGRLQEAGGIIWSDGSAWNYGRFDDPRRPQYNYVREADYISGAAILIPRPVWDELSGFDEHYLPAYCEDSDLAIRVRKMGKKVFYHPFAEVCHFEGISHGTDVTSGVKAHQTENQKKLYCRWQDVFQRDHYPSGQHLMRARDRARHGKVILVVDHYVPQPDRDAGSRTMSSFMQALVADGWSVKFWPSDSVYNPIYTPMLQSMGIETLYGPYDHVLAEWLLCNGDEIDCVLLSRPDIARQHLEVIKTFTRCPVAYYGHDLHFARMRLHAGFSSDAKLREDAVEMEALEKDIWRRVDVVLYPSQEEVDTVRSLCPEASAKVVLPYCFDQFPLQSAVPENPLVIFVAGFGHPPNVDAAVWLAETIWPLITARAPGARLALVGSNPTDEVISLRSDSIEVTGWVSDDELQRRYRSARVAVVPLRFGAGVKLKVVEALMAGTPLVTTPTGAQGLPGASDFVDIAEEAGPFADAVLSLLACDPAIWLSRSVRQTRYCEASFSRDNLRMSLREALRAASRNYRKAAGGSLSQSAQSLDATN